MTQITNKYTKPLSHVDGISLKSVDIDTFSLEIISEFTEKEFTETIFKNAPKYFPRTETKEKILRRWEKVDTYFLHQVTVQELMELRLTKIPGIVYKKENRLFYSAISGELNLAGKADDLGKHACGQECTRVCKDCPRTKALTVAYQQRFGKSFHIAVKDSWRIEKYNFIHEGLETFNMFAQNDAFIVLQCENYQVNTTKRRMSHADVSALKLGLASYAWEDFGGTRAEMLQRLKANGVRGNTF